MSAINFKSKWFATLIAAWLTILGLASCFMVQHQTAGEMNERPSGVAIQKLATGGETQLIMAIHPKCPCTRASLDTLESCLLQLNNSLSCKILVYIPEGNRSDWWEAPTARRVRASKTWDSQEDPGGKLAQQLGIRASGGVVIVRDKSQLLYSGGLLSARNCPGESIGLQIIRQSLTPSSARMTGRPVYGCSLSTPSPGG